MNSFFESLPDWHHHKVSICNRIRQRKSPLKITLKTKDDPFFIERWIQHHKNIVGLENLIIFDNYSSDEKLEDVYSRFLPAGTLARFAGFHNNIHRVHEFPELYDALRNSCKHYIFLDTDEYLIRLGADGTFVQDGRIIDCLEQEKDISVFPGIWLENVSGYDNRFWMNPKMNHLLVGLRGGKPIISSSTNVRGLIAHNRQLPRECYSDRIQTNYFVLHLKRLSPQQRISANLAKLRSYGAAAQSGIYKNISLEEALAIRTEDLALGNRRTWIREIQTLSTRSGEAGVLPGKRMALGMVELSDGTTQFTSEQQRLEFEKFVGAPQNLIEEIFRAA